jgi:hypothetical protein
MKKFGKSYLNLMSNLRNQIKNILLNLSEFQKNPELKFENKILDQLGLSQCQKCENQYQKQKAFSITIE